jgi:hypothetical protein
MAIDLQPRRRGHPVAMYHIAERRLVMAEDGTANDGLQLTQPSHCRPP